MNTVSFSLSEDIRRLADLIDEATAVLSPDGIVVHANPAFCELYGYAASELAGLHYTMLSAEPECSQEAFLAQKSYVALRIHLHQDGRLLPVQLRLSFPGGSAGNAAVFMTVCPADRQRRGNDLQWRYAVEASGDGLWEWHPRTGRTIRSESWYRMLGYSAADGELQEQGFWSSRIHPADRDRVMSALEDCLAGTSELYQSEYRLLCGDGKWRWILARAKVVERDVEGPLRVIGSHRDIDDLVRAREEQQESQALIEMFLEYVPDAAALTTSTDEHVYLAVNETYCHMLECRRDELIGTSAVANRVWVNEIQGRAARELLRKGVPIDDLQCRLRTKLGKEIITSLSARRVMIGGKYCIFALHRDIRQRAEAEVRLRESEARWRFAIEGYGDALWEWRVREQQIYRSTRWLEMLGLPREAELVSLEEHGRAFVTEDLPEISAAFRELLAGRVQELAGECRLRHQSGEQIWVSYRCRAMAYDDKNYPVTIIGTSRDITRERAQKKELDAQLDRLSHSGRLLVLGEMVAAIAHEINQPLAVISSYAGVLQRKSSDPETRELATRMENETLRAGQVVWRIRQFSRLKALECKRWDLRELIADVVEWMRSDRRNEEILFRKDLPEQPLHANVDRVLIEQALINLVRNAVQSMAGMEGEHLIGVRACRDDARAECVIEISDRGCGLPDQVAFDIYQPFYTTKPDGLGLGLSITHSIIDRHGGRLWSSAREGGGTIFSFTLPTGAADLPASDAAERALAEAEAIRVT